MSKDTIVEAKTFTCQYINREDRLLLTINYAEIEKRVDFWITRGFLLKLLPYFFDFLSHADTGSTAGDGYKVDNSINPTDTSTFTLMQKEPILLDSVDLKRLDSAEIKVVFKSLQKRVYCTAILEQKLFESVVRLILKSAPAMEWGTYTI